jgi:hypothetical protein
MMTAKDQMKLLRQHYPPVRMHLVLFHVEHLESSLTVKASSQISGMTVYTFEGNRLQLNIEVDIRPYDKVGVTKVRRIGG